MIDWLFFSCIASFVIAIGLGVVLFVNWRLDRQAEQTNDADAIFAALWGDQHPHRNGR